MEAEFTIYINEQTLSDGSKVFDVEFEGAVFQCITEGHAADLAETIAEAINKHSNNTAEVRY